MTLPCVIRHSFGGASRWFEDRGRWHVYHCAFTRSSNTDYKLRQIVPYTDFRASLVEGFDHCVLVGRIDRTGTHAITQFEDALHHAEFSSSGIDASHGHPIIDHHASSYDRTTSVDTASNQGNLKET